MVDSIKTWNVPSMPTTEGTLLQCDKTLESTSNMELGYTFSWLNRWNAHLKEYPVKVHILADLYTSYKIPNKYTLLSLIYKFFVKNLNNLFFSMIRFVQKQLNIYLYAFFISTDCLHPYGLAVIIPSQRGLLPI